MCIRDRCTIEGHPINKLNAEVGKLSQVEMSCTLPNGKPLPKRLTIEAKLTSSQDESVIQTKVQHQHGGKYSIQYVPHIRGRHKLEITANNIPVAGSPFPVVVKIPPTQLGEPVKVISGVVQPYDIAINSAGDVLVAEHVGDVLMLDKTGKRVHSIKRSQHGFKRLRGIALDRNDNVYVTDYDGHGLFKFDSNYEIVNKIILYFKPWGVTVVDEHVIVTGSSKPFVFTRDLEFIRAINCPKRGRGIAHDEYGNLYICDNDSQQIHVVTLKGLDQDSIHSFGDKLQHGIIKSPQSVCVDKGLVYITDWSMYKYVSVFTREGIFATSFGSYGQASGCFMHPTGLAVDADGVLYVCDYNRVQLF